jgi:integrase
MASVRKRTWSDGKTAWIVDYAANGVRERKHFPNKKAADAFRVAIEGQVAAGTYRSGKVTVAQACEAFLGNCEARHRRDERMTRKMLAVYRGHCANYIAADPVGALRLAQFTARAVAEFRDRLRETVSVPTTRKILATLHSVLEYAIAQDWCATNAARGVRVIGPRGEGSRKITPPSKTDLRALLDAADPLTRLMITFAASTGARAGEQWAARWGDIDLELGELRIARRVDVYGEEGVPKTAAGVRTVPLSATLVAALRAWKLQSRYSKPDDLIFPNRRGGHVGHDNLMKRRFAPLFEASRAKRFSWHGLRHFAVSTWIEAGLTPKTVQTFAGHASLQVTMDRYGHLFPSDDHKRAMDQIGRDIFNPTLP